MCKVWSIGNRWWMTYFGLMSSSTLISNPEHTSNFEPKISRSREIEKKMHIFKCCTVFIVYTCICIEFVFEKCAFGFAAIKAATQ
jgi:hypothetical protein